MISLYDGRFNFPSRLVCMCESACVYLGIVYVWVPILNFLIIFKSDKFRPLTEIRSFCVFGIVNVSLFVLLVQYLFRLFAFIFTNIISFDVTFQLNNLIYMQFDLTQSENWSEDFKWTFTPNERKSFGEKQREIKSKTPAITGTSSEKLIRHFPENNPNRKRRSDSNELYSGTVPYMHLHF